jgi:hypothetical protein
MHYRYHETFYHINIRNSGVGAADWRLTLDGVKLSDDFVTLADDGRSHEVEVENCSIDSVEPGLREMNATPAGGG